MTAKYHINGSGEPGRCSARAGGCPFGSVEEHFNNANSAREAYEIRMNKKSIPESTTRETLTLEELDIKVGELDKLQKRFHELNEFSSQDVDRSISLITEARAALTDNRWESTKASYSRRMYEEILRKTQKRIGSLKNNIKNLEKGASETKSTYEKRVEKLEEKLEKTKKELPKKEEQCNDGSLSKEEHDNLNYQIKIMRNSLNRVIPAEIEHCRKTLDGLKTGSGQFSRRLEGARERLQQANTELDEIYNREPREVTDDERKLEKIYNRATQTIHRSAQLLIEKDISNSDLKKLAATKPHPDDYPPGLYGPDSHRLIYKHKNASEETKNIAASNSKNIRIEKRLDDIQKINKNILNDVVAENTPNVSTDDYGYIVTEIKVDKEKIRNLGLDRDEETRLAHRLPYSGRSKSYNQKTGILRVTSD